MTTRLAVLALSFALLAPAQNSPKASIQGLVTAIDLTDEELGSEFLCNPRRTLPGAQGNRSEVDGRRRRR